MQKNLGKFSNLTPCFDELLIEEVDESLMVDFIEAFSGTEIKEINETVHIFSKSFRLAMKELAAALNEKNAERFSSSAHRLRSSCGAVGAKRLMKICEYFELYSLQDNVDFSQEKLTALLSRMDDYYTSFSAILLERIDSIFIKSDLGLKKGV